MKLRLRSHESRETLRLEVPSLCTLHQLKESLSQAISSSPSCLHFSLNRKDEVPASSPQASLHSLGVTAGDLIYYSNNPTAFVSQTLGENQGVNIQGEIFRDNGTPDANLGIRENPVQESLKIEEIGVNLQESVPRKSQETLVSELCSIQEPKSKEADIRTNFEIPDSRLEIDTDSQLPIPKSIEISQEIPVQEEAPNVEKQETLEFPSTETMDIDESSVNIPGKIISEPYFLRRVLREELGYGVGPHGFVIVAVHAVLLESGFVGFDSVSGIRIGHFDLSDLLLSRCTSMSYTLPELLNDRSTSVIESVVLRFQCLAHFVNVYGSLSKGNSGVHKVCLNAYKFGPIISLIWGNSDKNGGSGDTDENKNLNCEVEVFEFWKIVKDGLVLPLLIDLCDKAGLSLPACLMRLPTELKLKILESLPGADVAKLECVSREMRYLASNNDLWKQKFAEEFGGGSGAQGNTNWKERFVSNWEYNKRKRGLTRWYPRSRPYPIIRDHIPFGPQIGGDYDLYQQMPFVPFPFGQRRRGIPRFHGQRNFSPNCNLGGT